VTFLVQEHYGLEYYQPQVDRYVRRTRFTRHRLENVFGLLDGVAGKRVLDLGCGMGTFTVESSRMGGRVVGIDAAVTGLVVGRRLASEMQAATARFVAADVAQLPLPDASFDAVICADLTEHVDDDTVDAMLREVARVLVSDGVLALYTPSPTHLFERLKEQNWLMRQDPSHVGLRDMAELRESILRAGLVVERAYHRPTHLPLYRTLERACAPIPGVGGLFRRRVCIRARKSSGRS